MKLSDDISANIKKFNLDFGECSDFLLREITLPENNGKLFIAIMDGLVDSLQLSQMVVKPIISAGSQSIDEIKKSVVNSVELKEVETYNDCYYYMMSGFAVVIADGCEKALVCGIQQPPARDTNEPENESSVKAPKECFVETLNQNKALLRKRLKTPRLKMKQIKLGSDAPVSAVIAYYDGRVNKELLSLIQSSITKPNFSTVTDIGTLIPFIDTNIYSVFSTVSTTERPDIAVSKLLEGRIVIILDGSPFAIYTPSLFSDSFESPDDYDNPPFYAAFIRILRYFSFVISIFLPGAYVAVGTFHQELIPTLMLFTIAKEEITTPYSLMTEAIIILIMYEIMREAGLRLPKAVGHAVSIIGGIVIGETTVSAGLIGAPMLVVIALTAISSYVVSPLYESVSVLRFIFIILGGLTGMYGLILGGAVICVNACSLSPYGIPFTAPISPLDVHSLGDIFCRLSWLKLSKRKVRIDKLRGASIYADKSRKK